MQNFKTHRTHISERQNSWQLLQYAKLFSNALWALRKKEKKREEKKKEFILFILILYFTTKTKLSELFNFSRVDLNVNFTC